MTSQYVRKLDEALEILENSRASKIRLFSYGTVIYIPPSATHKDDPSVSSTETNSIDFGTSCASDKKSRCPRVLLVSTWSDAKFGFVGDPVSVFT
jgi:ADP-dependent phosphofructokinase/glucokinase